MKMVCLNISRLFHRLSATYEVIPGDSLFLDLKVCLLNNHISVVLGREGHSCSHRAIHDPAVIIAEFYLDRGMGEGKFTDKLKDFLAEAEHLLFRDIFVHNDM